jgi:outer membrane receptor for ferrienterochelin and colicins
MQSRLGLRAAQRAVGLALAFGTLVEAAHGADAPQAGAESSTQVFDREFFARYDTVNAEDMVRRVPGATSILDGLQNQQQQRGFGSGGDQVLLNGKRFAGKGQILAALRRIQSGNVLRIELIRGNSGETNVLSEGLIVNVVLEEGASTGAGTWQIGAVGNDEKRLDATGLASYSDSLGALDYILGIETNAGRPAFYLNGIRDENYFFPNGAVMEGRTQDLRTRWRSHVATANLTYNFENGDRFRLNGLYERSRSRKQNLTQFTRYNAGGTQTLQAQDLSLSTVIPEIEWEVGGDYEGQMAGGNLNILFINTHEREPEEESRTLIIGPNTVELSRSINVGKETETILRGSVTWPIFTGQTLEIGAEGARNMLRQHLRPFFDINGDGRVEEVATPVANARVREMRGEAFANHNWQITSSLSLNSSLTVEVSRISTNFPFSPGNTYVYPKHRFDLRYDFTPADQFRFMTERKISQLDFSNFVPEFDVVDSELDAGNPNLKPEQSWDFEAGYQRELPRGQGLIEARAFYKSIRNLIDKFIFDIEPDGTRISAEGNVGSARHYGIEANGSVRMTALGLPDLVIDARILRQFSSVRDPFTNRSRRLNFTAETDEVWPLEIDLGFRHDLTAWGMSYGLKYTDRHGDLPFTDIRVQKSEGQGPQLEAFAEKKLTGGLTLRVEGYGLIPQRSKFYQRRTLYSDDIIGGTVSRREAFVAREDRRFVVSLRGTF